MIVENDRGHPCRKKGWTKCLTSIVGEIIPRFQMVQKKNSDAKQVGSTRSRQSPFRNGEKPALPRDFWVHDILGQSGRGRSRVVWSASNWVRIVNRGGMDLVGSIA